MSETKAADAVQAATTDAADAAQPKAQAEAKAEGQSTPSWIDWTVEVEDFGPIKQAAITMAPLVILVGKNNTGKSYMATLLWGLLNPAELFRSDGQDRVDKAPDWFREAERTADSGINSTPTAEVDVSYEAWRTFNTWLRNQKNNIISRIFSTSMIKINKFEINARTIRKLKNSVAQLTFPIGNASIGLSVDESTMFFVTLDAGSRNQARAQNINQKWEFVATFIYQWLLCGIIPLGEARAPYLPAARTGLMLAYKPLVATFFESFGLTGQRQPSSLLPLPTIRLLQALTVGQRREPAPHLDAIAESLEQNVLGGSVLSSAGPTPDYTYRPAGRSIELPLHVTSSLVTELAPFIILLKTSERLDALVFEEPEAHLHLDAQRHLARAIVSLVNAGVAVVLTTHSDTFLQEINNLIGVWRSPQKAELMRKFGLNEGECLDPKHARVYEFVNDGAGTVVKPAPLGDDGFVVESINSTLRQIADDSFAIPSADGAEA